MNLITAQLLQCTAEAICHIYSMILNRAEPGESMHDVSISVCKSNELRDDTRGNLRSNKLNGAYVCPV